MRRTDAFTVLELMIAISILAILTAIALPTFQRLDLKAKTTEAKINLAAIRTHESIYRAEFGVFISAAQTPGTLPGATPLVFSGGGLTSFDELGFKPEGSVYFTYGVLVDSKYPFAYVADAQADLDGDMRAQVWGFRREDRNGNLPRSIGVNGCSQVNIGTARDVRNTVGPCGAAFGQSIF